jgi:hypothetical protein
VIETITYSCLIILLPIIPSLILYLAIPSQKSEVEGKYQGLNIKLKGAFGSYFILVLMLFGFVATRVATDHKFEYWTIEGVIGRDGVDDPRQVRFSIQPPVRQVTEDGRFIIENVPIAKGKNQRSTLSLQFVKNGETRSQVVHLEKHNSLPFPTHKLKFTGDHVAIETPIVLKLAASSNPNNAAAGSYNPAIAQDVNQ